MVEEERDGASSRAIWLSLHDEGMLTVWEGSPTTIAGGTSTVWEGTTTVWGGTSTVRRSGDLDRLGAGTSTVG